MASKVVDEVEHCGSDNNDEVTTGKSTVVTQNRRRLSKKSNSMDIEISSIDQPENAVVSFGEEDTVFTVKGGLIEGHVTIKEIADAINDCAQKDMDNETAEIFANIGSGRRRSSVLRDRELERAAAELGDRMI